MTVKNLYPITSIQILEHLSILHACFSMFAPASTLSTCKTLYISQDIVLHTPHKGNKIVLHLNASSVTRCVRKTFFIKIYSENLREYIPQFRNFGYMSLQNFKEIFSGCVMSRFLPLQCPSTQYKFKEWMPKSKHFYNRNCPLFQTFSRMREAKSPGHNQK